MGREALVQDGGQSLSPGRAEPIGGDSSALSLGSCILSGGWMTWSNARWVGSAGPVVPPLMPQLFSA